MAFRLEKKITNVCAIVWLIASSCCFAMQKSDNEQAEKELHPDLVVHLALEALEEGTEVNMPIDDLGRHPLAIAYINRDLESLKILRIFGSNADFQFSDGKTLANLAEHVEINIHMNIIRTPGDYLIRGYTEKMRQRFQTIAQKRSIEQAIEAHYYGGYTWPLIHARKEFVAGCSTLTPLPQVLWEEVWRYFVPPEEGEE